MEEQVRSYEVAGKLEAAARLHEQMVLLQVCVHGLKYGLNVFKYWILLKYYAFY